MPIAKYATILTMLFLSCSISSAQDIFVFPKAEQTKEQTEQDKFQCHSWSVEQTGFDPFSAKQPVANSDRTSTVDEPLLNCSAYGAGRGAVGGAASGYITGRIIGGKKKRATNLGAITGAMAGAAKKDQCEADNAARRSRNEKRRALAENESTQNSTGSRSNYVRAYKTCLEAKDYATS